jgi:oligogalacturonide transporter
MAGAGAGDPRRVRLRHLAAYGMGDIYGVGAFVIIGLLFMYFLTDVVRLDSFWAGLVVMLGKAWDALSDPLMGHISDHTRSRLGRRRLYFAAGVVPVGLTFALLWLPVRPESAAMTFAYFALAYVLFSTCFTMVMVPYAALNAEMSRDYATRTRLSAARMVFGGLSTLVVGAVPREVVRAFDSPQTGHLVMGLVFAVYFALPWLVVYLGTWELPAVRSEGGARRSTWAALLAVYRGFGTVLANRSFRVHMGMYVCAYSAIDILMATIIYYLTYYVDRAGAFAVVVFCMLVAQLGAILLYVRVANRHGKGRAYALGMVIWGVVLASGMWIIRPDSATVTLVVLFVLAGAGMAAGAMMPWAILPSITDVDELITGEQRAGVYAGSMTFVRKLVQALVLFGVGATLTWIGYAPDQPQSPETLAGLRRLFHFAPAAFIAAGVVFSTRFRITPRTHAVLTAEIARLRAGGDRDSVTPETRTVCELLTGLPYERLYRRGGAGTGGA